VVSDLEAGHGRQAATGNRILGHGAQLRSGNQRHRDGHRAGRKAPHDAAPTIDSGVPDPYRAIVSSTASAIVSPKRG
jgi:hypothetical protein